MVYEVPTPTITAHADGHWATCPDCRQRFAVAVIERPHPEGATFVLTREPPGPNGERGKPVEVADATVVEYDLSEYEQHHAKAHPETVS